MDGQLVELLASKSLVKGELTSRKNIRFSAISKTFLLLVFYFLSVSTLCLLSETVVEHEGKKKLNVTTPFKELLLKQGVVHFCLKTVQESGRGPVSHDFMTHDETKWKNMASL